MAVDGLTFPNLFRGFRIRGVELSNRIVLQPHFTALGSDDGMPSDAHVAYHEERARGGVGLIVFESQAVHPTGKMSRRFVNAWDPAAVAGYRKITDAVHRHGARIFGQLTHGGHTSLVRIPEVLWAPTQMPEPSSNFSTKAMDESDIREVITGFATAARNASEGGFDGVEIKVAHDGLLRSFASPFFNHRTDRYGGAFENRMRLSVEVLDAIKNATSDAYPVGVRICLHEYTPWGYELDYGLRMAEHLEAAGLVDYFNCDAGSFSSYWMEIPPFAVAQGAFRELNRQLKQASDLPVIAFGRIKRPEMAEEIVATGEADLVGMARQLIADPETPNKLREGRAGEVRFCIGCNDACIREVGLEKPIRCVHNPGAGRERECSERMLSRASAPVKVVIVGGGPAGLKVAEIVAKRGHGVTLLEREAELGGQLRLAARQPLHGEIIEVATYLEQAAARLGVEVHLDTEATPESVAALEPDAIVVATGSQPNLPATDSRARLDRDASTLARADGRVHLDPVSGLELDHVLSADEILTGRQPPGPRVLLVDGNGHWEAAGTAEYLAESGCEVEVITRRHVVGSDLEGTSFETYTQRAAQKGIRLTPHTLLVAVEPGRARIVHSLTREASVRDVDAVVPVIGRRSRDDLYLALSQMSPTPAPEIHRVGDCVAPRLLQSVIFEAFKLGREVGER